MRSAQAARVFSEESWNGQGKPAAEVRDSKVLLWYNICMKINAKLVTMFAALAPAIVLGGVAEPVGFKEQCQKKLW